MSRRRRLFGRLAAAVAVASALLWVRPHVAKAATAAGTVITNTSSASYQDASSNNYNANSNTVSITVQNAPSVTVTGQGITLVNGQAASSSTQPVAPGQTVTDSFQVTNTGNAAGDVQISSSSSGVVGGTDSASTTVSYAYNGTSYATLAALNTALASVSVAVNGSITVSVVYAIASNASAGTVQTGLNATISYPAVTGAAAATSTATSATNTADNVYLDALLDVALSSTTGATTITYTASAVDRTSYFGAKDLSAVKSLLGSSSAGIFISVKIPAVSGTTLTLSGTPTVTTSSTYGFATGATATIYSTASATGTSGWTAGSTPVANATYIGVFVSGGSCTINGVATTGLEICPIASAGSSAGVVPHAAVTLTFSVTQSSASGSANAGSTQTLANSLIGGNGSTEYVIGPGITANSLADAGGGADTSSITATGAGINNTTPVNAPSGASTLDSTQSTTSYAAANGPFGNPDATGSYDGTSGNFTAVSFTSTNTYATTNTTPSFTPTITSVTAGAVNNIKVENTLKNEGNSADTYTIVAQAPPNWTVYLESDSSGPAGSLGGSAVSSSGGTSTALNVSVASGASLNYWTVYTAPAGVTYLSHVVGTIKATSNGNSAISSTTANLIYAGFVAITTTAVTSNTSAPNCPSSVVSPNVCPGGTITYTIDYRNIVNSADSTSVPSVSFAGVVSKAGTLVITADGTNGTGLGNNWGLKTAGPTAVPVDSTSGTTYTYWTGSTGATSAASFQSGLTKFIATVGGATFQLVPCSYGSGTCQGTITFSVIVN